jgi:hypothetical protein
MVLLRFTEGLTEGLPETSKDKSPRRRTEDILSKRDEDKFVWG